VLCGTPFLELLRDVLRNGHGLAMACAESLLVWAATQALCRRSTSCRLRQAWHWPQGS
jgi:hypothetical protein